ncbi:Receptor-type tyrosine-protein phosphatase-like N [Collichthys lucidus]|uniref:Receptor-type tyrosine-protein phosphatase-like N n=1 Tax=Collichthys lucidus TaxID=240159 RepID=A0A4U5U029_COLLU|nr:Receptor-type tyrosine-protein phosphatase-like N [Collichthys lucidus]
MRFKSSMDQSMKGGLVAGLVALLRSKQLNPPYHRSSKSGSTSPGGNYVDYMIVEPPQSPLRMQTASMDPYTYHQHRYQDVERSLLGAGGGYARPSSRSQTNQRERERDRQLLQEALSHYLASAQPSYRQRGAAPMAPAGLPYYEDFEVEIPVDYVEDYTLEERLGSCYDHTKCRAVQRKYRLCYAVLDDLLQRMSGVLQRYGTDPRELSQEQLYKLALILQLRQAQDKTDPTEKDLVTLKEMQLLKTDSVSHKPAKPAPVPGPPAAPPATSSASVPATPPAKSASKSPSASQPPQVAPAEAGHGLKEQGPPLVEGTGAKEEYGYIITNQSHLSLYEGVKLLELLADKIHLTTSSFINIRFREKDLSSKNRKQSSQTVIVTLLLSLLLLGVKEIDIAASLEHIRDQRPGLVRTKDQFEFALTAVAEEVNAILKALPQ